MFGSLQNEIVLVKKYHYFYKISDSADFDTTNGKDLCPKIKIYFKIYFFIIPDSADFHATHGNAPFEDAACRRQIRRSSDDLSSPGNNL